MPTPQSQQQPLQQTDGQYLVRRSWKPLKKSLITSLVVAFLWLLTLTQNNFTGAIFLILLFGGLMITLVLLIILLAFVASFRAAKQYSNAMGTYKRQLLSILISSISVEVAALYLFFWLGRYLGIGDQNFYVEFLQWLPTFIGQKIGAT